MNSRIIKRNMRPDALTYYTVTEATTGYATPTLSTSKTLDAYIIEECKIVKGLDNTDYTTRASIFLDGGATSSIKSSDKILLNGDKLDIIQYTPYYNGNVVDYLLIRV